MSEREELTKIVVDLPHHWVTGGESMWAKPLGDDLYEARNIPFYAYGLNYLDVVRAIAPDPEKKPVALGLVEARGHRTLRVHFAEGIAENQRIELMTSLNDLKAYFEGGNPRYFAIDVEPDGDYEVVCRRLADWESEGILAYETCEARVVGSFDDAPEDPEASAE